MQAGTLAHTHSPDGLMLLGDEDAPVHQCTGGEEVVHGGIYSTNSQPGSPGVRGQLQWASCLPASAGSPTPQAAPKIQQLGSRGSGAGVKSCLKGT